MRALLVEDNPGDARLLTEALTSGTVTTEVIRADCLKTALSILRKEEVDVVALDLGLPDSQGFETVMRIHQAVPDVPIVVLTGLDDEASAVKALHEGVQDYLVKGSMTEERFAQSIRFAVERHRVVKALQDRLAQERQRKEIESFGRLTQGSPVSARTVGSDSLRKSLPELFGELVDRYAALLDKGLEEQTHKVEATCSEGIQELADELGFLKAGPRDVIEIHTTALERKTRTPSQEEAASYLNEGRFRVLELMGNLVRYYRNYYTGAAVGMSGPGDEQGGA